MFRKNYFSLLVAAALFLSGSLFVFAQTAPVRGKVELKKADGTTQPVAGAMVEVFRTDAKGKGTTAKTNKKGEFAFAGLMLGQTFALSISAPNVKPGVYPNVRAGNENVLITVVEGDSKRLTKKKSDNFWLLPPLQLPAELQAFKPALILRLITIPKLRLRQSLPKKAPRIKRNAKSMKNRLPKSTPKMKT
jgi:hypothetical protein